MMPKFEPSFSNSMPEEFFLQKAEILARKLLGKVLVKKEDSHFLAAMIVETEAYLPQNDFASHSAVGLTKRNAAMFEKGGILYVYKSYGIHHCVNCVAGEKGVGTGVLLRAAIPLLGIDEMKARRKSEKIETLCKGPGNLGKAFGFTLKDNLASLRSKELFFQSYKEIKEENIMVTKRIGITKSAELELRFLI
ncbi:MAG: DNA-3-methyladenine glycosylase [Ignavibacteria bacterium]|jgi:DNA-3-methyladenine glycosylase|nr:DNA-3-methyladenine glycosylase [Ignavibacteria bacterium]